MAQSPLDQLIDQREEALRRLADIDAKIAAVKETRRVELLAELAALGLDPPDAHKTRRRRLMSAEPIDQRILAALAVSEPQTAKQIAGALHAAGASTVNGPLKAMVGRGVLIVTKAPRTGKGLSGYLYRRAWSRVGISHLSDPAVAKDSPYCES